MNCSIRTLGRELLFSVGSVCKLLCPPGWISALELSKRCLRRNSLDSVIVVTFSSTLRGIFLPCPSIWRWIFMLCAWRLMHSHNFSFQVARRNYPLNPCLMPEDGSELSHWIFMKQRSFSAKIKQDTMGYFCPNLLSPYMGSQSSPRLLLLLKVMICCDELH